MMRSIETFFLLFSNSSSSIQSVFGLFKLLVVLQLGSTPSAS